MADPTLGFFRLLEGLATDVEKGFSQLHQWYTSRGGAQVLAAFLEKMQSEALEKVLGSLDLHVEANKNNFARLARKAIRDWFFILDQQEKRKSQCRPCHWCTRPAPDRCSSCSKQAVHETCMRRRAPALPEHLDLLCRNCARKKFELWVKYAGLEALQTRGKELDITVYQSSKNMMKALRTICNFEEQLDDEQVSENAEAEGAAAADAQVPDHAQAAPDEVQTNGAGPSSSSTGAPAAAASASAHA